MNPVWYSSFDCLFLHKETSSMGASHRPELIMSGTQSVALLVRKFDLQPRPGKFVSTISILFHDKFAMSHVPLFTFEEPHLDSVFRRQNARLLHLCRSSFRISPDSQNVFSNYFASVVVGDA